MKTNILLSALIILASLTACTGTFEIGLEPSGASANAGATSTSAPLSTEIIVPPVTVIPQPTATAEIPVATEATSPTDTPAGTPSVQMVQIYLIAIDDNGQAGVPVGCGDSAVAVQVQIQPTQGVLKAALEALLSIKEQYYGLSGLYNALYQSDLQVEKVEIKNGKAEVYLTGSMMLGGVCDTPRVQAQLEQTVLQFSTVTEAEIFINGKPLADALSLKGE